jgi:hypothetical protein
VFAELNGERKHVEYELRESRTLHNPHVLLVANNDRRVIGGKLSLSDAPRSDTLVLHVEL